MPQLTLPVFIFLCVFSIVGIAFIYLLRIQKLKLTLLQNQQTANELLINEQQKRIVAQQDLIECNFDKQEKNFLENEQVSKQSFITDTFQTKISFERSKSP